MTNHRTVVVDLDGRIYLYVVAGGRTGQWREPIDICFVTSLFFISRLLLVDFFVLMARGMHSRPRVTMCAIAGYVGSIRQRVRHSETPS